MMLRNNYFQKKFRLSENFILWVGLIIFGLIISLNSMMRFDSQIFTCSFWLICEGDLSTPYQINLLLQFLLAIFGTLTIIFAGLRSLLNNNKMNLIRYFLPGILLGFTILTIGTYSYFFTPVSPLIQSSFSLALALILITWIFKSKPQEISLSSSQNNKQLSILLFVSSILMMGLGLIISITDITQKCDQFPVCISNNGFSFDFLLINSHRFFTITTGLFLSKLLIIVWQKYRGNPQILVSMTMSFIIFIGQSFVGALQIGRNLPLDLLFVHSTGSVIYIISIFYAVNAIFSSQETNSTPLKTIFNDSQRRKDFLILNKPIIVALLLVTTYAGMVVGGEKIPSLSLTFWTLLGGALSAGGASAINQFIDREIDQSMQRTAKRPLPSGRLLPAEALALGVSEIILSFYIFTIFVNLNAALLAMAGMVYYVFIYSVWLKHATVQNIVIGGGAGAIPPLVGWASVTGGLNIPSLFLFALIFLWTPPHFWALALVRKNDYARASVPMLPVIKGEKNTRLQILIYTIQLVLLTILMPIIGIGGSIYLLFAIILGLWLLHTAWQVFKKEGNKIAFKMYRYSSMYLAFIFLALVIDVLI